MSGASAKFFEATPSSTSETAVLERQQTLSLSFERKQMSLSESL